MLGNRGNCVNNRNMNKEMKRNLMSDCLEKEKNLTDLLTNPIDKTNINATTTTTDTAMMINMYPTTTSIWWYLNKYIPRMLA